MNRPPTTTPWRMLTLLLALVEVVLFVSNRSPPPPHALRCDSAPGSAPPAPRFMMGDDAGCAALAAPPFWELGVAVATDKVTQPETTIGMSHAYQFAYERYMRPRRCEPLSVLEIGLGCGMPYFGSDGKQVPAKVAGHSVPLWLAFLPRAIINTFEFSEKCARAFFADDPLKIGAPLRDRVKMFLGDQSKDADLLKAMATMGPQDVIIDDGGHSMMQQQTSLRVLFPFVKPGGLCALRAQRLRACLRARPPSSPLFTPSYNRYNRGLTNKLLVDGPQVARQSWCAIFSFTATVSHTNALSPHVPSRRHWDGRLRCAADIRASLARACKCARQGRVPRARRAPPADQEH